MSKLFRNCSAISQSDFAFNPSLLIGGTESQLFDKTSAKLNETQAKIYQKK